MKKPATAKQSLLHILFPDTRAQIVWHLFGAKQKEYYVRELTRSTTLSLLTVQRELAHLSAAGLLVSRSDGYYRFYRANRQHPAFAALQRLAVRDEHAASFVSNPRRPKRRRRLEKRDPLQRPNMISTLGLKRNVF